MSQTEILELLAHVSTKEVDEALFSIHFQNDPCIYGFNSFFYNKVWHIVKKDIHDACLSFFQHCKLPRVLNCTTISLNPKILNPTFVREFRPITCANVLYKIIAKILSSRLQKISPFVINLAQAGFILGRKILDNVLLASELIKGYGSKSLTQCV